MYYKIIGESKANKYKKLKIIGKIIKDDTQYDIGLLNNETIDLFYNDFYLLQKILKERVISRFKLNNDKFIGLGIFDPIKKALAGQIFALDHSKLSQQDYIEIIHLAIHPDYYLKQLSKYIRIAIFKYLIKKFPERKSICILPQTEKAEKILAPLFLELDQQSRNKNNFPEFLKGVLEYDQIFLVNIDTAKKNIHFLQKELGILILL